MSDNNRPIGIFDSGIGGLTVVSEVMALLPHEDLIYFGDTAHVPYGSKSPEAVTRFSMEIACFLQTKNSKMLVVACNTATAHALPALHKSLNMPIVGVIEPGAQCAAATTRNGRVGVIGTEGTVASGSYAKAIKSHKAAVKVFQQACPLFVPLVEEGWLDTAVTEQVARAYLAPLLKQKIDALVLGCTHYPLLKTVIGRVAGKKIVLIDSAIATAARVQNVLSERGLLRAGKAKGRCQFFVSDAPEKFRTVGRRFLGNRIATVNKVMIEGL